MPAENPQGYAERVWKQCTSLPMAPMHLVLSAAEMHLLRDAFLQEATQQACSMQVGNDIVNHYVQYIVIGISGT